MRRLIIDLLCLVVIEMVELLVMGGFSIFEIVFYSHFSCGYVRSIRVVLGRNPVPVDFVRDWVCCVSLCARSDDSNIRTVATLPSNGFITQHQLYGYNFRVCACRPGLTPATFLFICYLFNDAPIALTIKRGLAK
jgi:hypothetical protein